MASRAVNSQNFPDGPERMPMLFILFLRIEKRGKKYRVLHEAAVNGIVRSLFFQPPFQLPGDSQPAVAGMGIILIGNRRLISPVNIPDLLNKRVLCATDIALHIEKLVLRIGKILD